MTAQSDLFAAPLIGGLHYREEFLTLAGEAELLGRLDGLDLSPFRFHGWVGNRKTASFGWRYDFDDSSFAPAEPVPAWLEPLRAGAAAFANVGDADFVHCLIARYDPGAGIGWHKDRDVFDRVVGISLGSPAVLRFRHRADGGGFHRFALPIEPRSIYLLSGEARHQWEHRIVPGDARRYSITFRTLSEKGRRIAAAQRSS